MLEVRLDYVYRLLWDATLEGSKDEGVWRVSLKSVRAYLKKRVARSSQGITPKPAREAVEATA
jgi:hypothetical protein